MSVNQPTQTGGQGFFSSLLEQLRSSPSWLLFLLFLVSILNFLDRQVLSIVQEDIKAELALTDSQLGFLALGFGLVHASFALPIGRVADSTSRKNVLVACIAFWSTITMLIGFVTNYMQLLIARMGVAMGEAGVTPTAYSLIGDKFKLKRRATAIAIVGIGLPIGGMLSLALGGLIAENFGWRMTFVIFGVPGLILAAVFMLTVQAPARGESDGIVEVRETSFLSALYRLLRIRAYTFILLGATSQSIIGYGVVQWIPSLYLRKFDGLSTADVGMSLGPVMGLTGITGVLIAAYMADRLAARDVRWYSWIAAIGVGVSFPLLIAALMASNFAMSLLLFGLTMFFGNFTLAITNALIQNTAPVQMRGMAAGLKTVCLSFIGYGLGGLLIGALSDVFGGGETAAGLQMALIVAGCVKVLSTIGYFCSSFYLKADIEKATQLSEATKG